MNCIRRLARRTGALTLLFLSALAGPSAATERETYLGEVAPEATPIVFRPGSVSADGIEIALAVHPEESEVYVTRITSGRATILVSQKTAGEWTPLEPAPFSGLHDDAGPFIAADGTKLYFASKRPGVDESIPRDAYHLWVSVRRDGAWSEPTELWMPIESRDGESSPSLTRDGVLYYQADYPALGGAGFYATRLLDNATCAMPERVDVFPSDDGAVYVEPHVSPDGRFLLFYSAGRSDNLLPASRLGDLYVSFRGDGDAWTPARNLGAPINSAMEESSPSLSPDGRFLFFASNRAVRNRMPDIYWVSLAGIDGLAPPVEE